MSKEFLEMLEKEDNFTETENGAIALSSTLSGLLDAFGTLGAMRECSDDVILNTFYRAFAEDKHLAVKMLFYFRDIRGGAGERKLFRVIIKDLASKYPEIIKKNFDNFAFFGRYDDLLCLLDTSLSNDVVDYIKNTLIADMKAVESGSAPSLLGKWLPSENATSQETIRFAKVIRKGMDLSSKDYRKILSLLRNAIGIVETLMSEKRWNEINFEHTPSRARLVYADAFLRHDKDRYFQYLKDVIDGKATINAKALFPVDVIHKVMEKGHKYSEIDAYTYEAMWRNLQDYFEGLDHEETGICVVDVSGSMSGTPMEVAISLGMYCADKSKGAFKDYFITFSETPKLQKIVGNNIFEKVTNMITSDWDMNTNIEAVFDLILNTAIKNKCSQEEIPNKLYIISDMQFDECASTNSSKSIEWRVTSTLKKKEVGTFIDSMREKYEAKGYSLPNLVYWNVRESSKGSFQQDKNGSGCCFVSGYSPSLFKAVIQGTEFVEEVNSKGETVIREKIDPMTIMLSTLNNERYDRVVL